MIMFSFTLFLLKLFRTGEIHNLVSPMIGMLLKITTGVLLVMTSHALSTSFRFKRNRGYYHQHTHDNHHTRT
ncbi:DUF1980 domain-containing protein [Effusibacillus dendaii]|uniref:DUF1980 domain-containing protein n=1 Tax=Effusibacillus dendaii TaxID=2743772 RepID=UPI00384F3216